MSLSKVCESSAHSFRYLSCVEYHPKRLGLAFGGYQMLDLCAFHEQLKTQGT